MAQYILLCICMNVNQFHDIGYTGIHVDIFIPGELLQLHVIYGGKTSRCHPKYEFPKKWRITHSNNHWTNEETQMDYVINIVFPYLKAVRPRLKLSPNARALCIFDVFRAQMTEDFRDLLKSKHIDIVYVPPNCTDMLQPLDISVQKSVKASLKKSFEEWYSKQVMEQMSDANQDDIVINPVQMPMTQMRELFSKWMFKMYHEIKKNPGLIISGFRSAGIIAALEDCIPLNSFVKG